MDIWGLGQFIRHIEHFASCILEGTPQSVWKYVKQHLPRAISIFWHFCTFNFMAHVSPHLPRAVRSIYSEIWSALEWMGQYRSQSSAANRRTWKVRVHTKGKRVWVEVGLEYSLAENCMKWNIGIYIGMWKYVKIYRTANKSRLKTKLHYPFIFVFCSHGSYNQNWKAGVSGPPALGLTPLPPTRFSFPAQSGSRNGFFRYTPAQNSHMRLSSPPIWHQPWSFSLISHLCPITIPFPKPQTLSWRILITLDT